MLKRLLMRWVAFTVRIKAINVDDGTRAFTCDDFVIAHDLAVGGSAVAQAGLGKMYYDGEGILQDYAEAIKWWHKAADHGNNFAQFHLGAAYLSGHGVPEDYILAYMWTILAIRNGHERAQINRASLTKLLTPDQIAEAQKLAREWQERHRR